MSRVSLPLLQTLVGIIAGLVTIGGAAYSAVQLLRPGPGFGQVIAVVRDARTGHALKGATVEVLTPQDALVTTLTPAADGRAHQTLREGLYRLRVRHPQFSGDVRQVHVLRGQTAEVPLPVTLRGGGASAVNRATEAITEGVDSVRRVWREIAR